MNLYDVIENAVWLGVFTLSAVTLVGIGYVCWFLIERAGQ